MIYFVAQISLGEREIVPVIRFCTVEGAPLGHGRVLVFVDVFSVFAAALRERLHFAGRFQFAIKKRVLAGYIEFSVRIDGKHKSGRALDDVIPPEI